MSTLGGSERPGTPTSSTSIADSQSDIKAGTATKQPIFLPVGAAVSAKYRGAFCEALIERVDLNYRLRVHLKAKKTSATVDKASLVSGNIEPNADVLVKIITGEHASNLPQTATILRIVDISLYTVIFDDGDKRSLKRTQLVLKGERHFKESESLDRLPLTNPEQFRQPVIDHSRRYPSSSSESDEADDKNAADTSAKDNEKKEKTTSIIETPVRKPRVAPATPTNKSRNAKTVEGAKKVTAGRRQKAVSTKSKILKHAETESKLVGANDPKSYPSMLGNLVMIDMPIGPKAETPMSPSGSLNSSIVSDVGGTPSRRRFTPGLVVLPSAQPSIDLKTVQATAHQPVLLVRSFRDNRFYPVPQSCLQILTPVKAVKLAHRNPSLRSAFERAILWLDRRELPGAWGSDIETLLGPGWSNSDDSDTDTPALKKTTTVKTTTTRKIPSTATKKRKRLQQRQNTKALDSYSDEDGETYSTSSSSSTSKKRRDWSSTKNKNRPTPAKKATVPKTKIKTKYKARVSSLSSLYASSSSTSSSSSSTSGEESDASESSTNSAANFEARDRWIAHLYSFMDERGTPINKAPSIANKDLDLYKLYKIVKRLGRFHRVTSQLKWGAVYSEMDLPTNFTAGPRNLQTAFKKYLFPLDDLSRKLGTNLDEIPISRPRNHSQQQNNATMSSTSRRGTASSSSTITSGNKQPPTDASTVSSSPPKESTARKLGTDKAPVTSSNIATLTATSKHSTEQQQSLKHGEETKKEVAKRVKDEKTLECKVKTKQAPSSTKKAATAQKQPNLLAGKKPDSKQATTMQPLEATQSRTDSATTATGREKKSGENAEKPKTISKKEERKAPNMPSSDAKNRSSRPTSTLLTQTYKKSSPSSSSSPITTEPKPTVVKPVASTAEIKPHLPPTPPPPTPEAVSNKSSLQRLEVVKEPQSASSSPALYSFEKIDEATTKTACSKIAPISVGSCVRVRYSGKLYSAKIVKHVYPGSSTHCVISDQRPKSTTTHYDAGLLSDNSGSSLSSTTKTTNVKYCVHYTGWNARHDEVVSRERIISVLKRAPAGEMRRSPSCSTLNLSGRASSLPDASCRQSTDVGADASTSLSTRSIADDEDDIEEDVDMEEDDNDGGGSDCIANRRRSLGGGVDETASDSVAINKINGKLARRRRLLAGLKRPRFSFTFSDTEHVPKVAKLILGKCDPKKTSKRASSSSSTVNEHQKKRRSLDTPPLLSTSISNKPTGNDRKSTGLTNIGDEKLSEFSSKILSKNKLPIKPRPAILAAAAAVFTTGSSASSAVGPIKSTSSIVHAATCLANSANLLKRVMCSSTPTTTNQERVKLTDLEDISSDEDDFPPMREVCKSNSPSKSAIHPTTLEKDNKTKLGTPLRLQQHQTSALTSSASETPPVKRVKQEPPTVKTVASNSKKLASSNPAALTTSATPVKEKVGKNIAVKLETPRLANAQPTASSTSRKAPTKTITEVKKPKKSRKSRSRDTHLAKLSRESSSSGELDSSSSSNVSSRGSTSSAEEEDVEVKKNEQEVRRISIRRPNPLKLVTPLKQALPKKKEEEGEEDDSEENGSELDSSTSSSQLATASDALPRLTRSQHRLLLGDTPPGAQLQTAATTQAPALEKEEEDIFASHLPTLQEEDEEGIVTHLKDDIPLKESLVIEALNEHQSSEVVTKMETPASPSKPPSSPAMEKPKTPPSPIFTASSPLTTTLSLEVSKQQLSTASPTISHWNSVPGNDSIRGTTPPPMSGEKAATSSGQGAPSETSCSTEPMLRSASSPLFSSHDEDDDDEGEEAFGSAPQLFSPVSVSGGTGGNATVSDVEAGLTTSDDDGGEREMEEDSSSKPLELLLCSPIASSTTSDTNTAGHRRRSTGRRRRRIYSTSGETTSMTIEGNTPTTNINAPTTCGFSSSVEEVSESVASTAVSTTSSSSRRIGFSHRQGLRGSLYNRRGSSAITSPLHTASSDATATAPDLHLSSSILSSHPPLPPTTLSTLTTTIPSSAVSQMVTKSTESVSVVSGPSIRRFGGPFFPIARFNSMPSDLRCLKLQQNLNQILASWRSAKQLLKDLDMHRVSSRTKRLRTPARKHVDGSGAPERSASPVPGGGQFPATPPLISP